MAIFSLLMAFCFLTGYLTVGIASLTLPLNQGLDSIDSLTTLSLNVSSPAVQEFCTSSLIWVGSTSCDSQLTTDCFLAWKSFMTDFAEYKNVQFEFLQQGVTPAYPGLVKMATPRRYINSLCTIAIANLADIPRGILPSQPPGPFPRSDLARFPDFRSTITAVRAGCLGKRKEVGWAVTGKQRAMAVLLFVTNSPVDRIIPRGVIPSNHLNATTGAEGGLATVA